MVMPDTFSAARLNDLQRHVRAASRALPAPYPAFVLFFSYCDGEERAEVAIATGSSFDAAWQRGLEAVRSMQQRQTGRRRWLRIDWPSAVESSTWGELRTVLDNTKRNYFRLGLALDAGFECAFLEQELNGNAMLYGGNQKSAAELNEKNFLIYFRNRFKGRPAPGFREDDEVFLFAGSGVFFDGADIHPLHPSGLDAGRRVVDRLDVDLVTSMILDGSEFLARQVGSDGRFVYGYHPCFDRAIGSYNTLRHASATYAMIEAYEVTRSTTLRDAIDLSVLCLTRHLVSHALLPDGQVAAFLLEASNEIKLGGNALAILALAKYATVFGDEDHDDLMEKLALGICFMQDRHTGAFRHVLKFPSLQTQEDFRTIYYEGEAAFALMRLYDLTGDERWLCAVERAFGHFIRSGHARHHDHWLAYCVNELTRYRPREEYFRFAIDNVADHLDFVANRITTFPTLLELMMATREVLYRLRADGNHSHLLDRIDMPRFEAALEKRAFYLLNGHFWPETAMFMRNPRRIVGSFFIRHHAFRTRIDDVEHYLSGYVAYRAHLQRNAASATVTRNSTDSMR
ncbi:hypothetical protein SAMN03159496_00741 [Rhizobium sp. NFR07]|uniref:hypothetical protein n=1 Tax=Rhizobium sp. NFR07 TaxID=1566262 RepID=UPI0008E24B90|nr:hypothetical protein [Rhizobium sp. NFR07]SFA88844.1 hypothetical protein SAMN03159496_00741 [Rhizobium sp. NFR07]